MTVKIAAADAISSFAKILERVRTSGDEFIVEENGRVIARIGPDDRGKLKEEASAYLKLLVDQDRNPDLSEEDAMKLALEAQRGTRKELRELFDRLRTNADPDLTDEEALEIAVDEQRRMRAEPRPPR